MLTVWRAKTKGHKLQLFVILLGILTMLTVLLPRGHSQEYQAPTFQDPSSPSARYVLDKLNGHLLVNAQNQDRISTLEKRVDKIEAFNVPPVIAKLQEQVETGMMFLKCIFGGLISLLFKEFFTLFRRQHPTH